MGLPLGLCLSQSLPSGGSDIFATRLKIALVRRSRLSGPPDPLRSHKTPLPSIAERCCFFSSPKPGFKTRRPMGTQYRGYPGGALAFLAWPRLGAPDCCASSVTTRRRKSITFRVLDGAELQIHLVPGFAHLAWLLIETASPTLIFAYRNGQQPRPPAW